MNDQFTIRLGESLYTVYIQDGFSGTGSPSTHLHKHRYTELHAIIGHARFCVGDQVFEVKTGDIFSVPPNTLHACLWWETGLRHTAFQINAQPSDFSVHTVHCSFIRSFFQELDRNRSLGDYSDVCAYLPILCKSFFPFERIKVHKINDYAFIIQEFFSNQYNTDATLEDLATQLHLSKKQTERLVEKYTGNTFRRELIGHRMSMARHLIASTEMSLAQIARYVGYHTYSGFWKEFQKEIAKAGADQPVCQVTDDEGTKGTVF